MICGKIVFHEIYPCAKKAGDHCFNPFIFKVITDKEGIVSAILHFVFCKSYIFLSLIFSIKTFLIWLSNVL